MRSTRRLIVSLSLIAAAVPCAAAAAASSSATAAKPHILEFQYSQDYEGIGTHYEVGATVKGEAESVTARLGQLTAEGRLSGHIRPSGPGRLWFFESHPFVKALRADLQADGTATVAVRAANQGELVRKRCTLDFQPDPQFGDFAGGRCKRLGG
jgi:hypothetical protein